MNLEDKTEQVNKSRIYEIIWLYMNQINMKEELHAVFCWNKNQRFIIISHRVFKYINFIH